MKILIADDHAVVRTGVMRLLESGFGQIAFGEAGDGRQTVAAVMRETWDLAIVDIAMPGRNGLEVLKDLKALRPELPVLVFTMYPEEQYAVRALQAGAAGYLTKASLSKELTAAVHKVLNGGKYVSAELAELLATEVGASSGKPQHALLSDREYQILCLIGSGKTVKEIGTELSLSIHTVSTYRARILDKMRMRTNAELTRYAVENQLLG